MRKHSRQHLPEPDEVVVVPWGRSEVEGRVVDAYASGDQPYVTVDVLLEGADEPMRVTFPSRAVRRDHAAAGC